MTWYLIYDLGGKAVSIGTVLADPMPDGLTVVELSETQQELLLSGRGIWNPASLDVDIKPEHLWPSVEDQY